jgi:hypothetical protein
MLIVYLTQMSRKFLNNLYVNHFTKDLLLWQEE